MAGYSAKPLAQKLGLKSDSRFRLINAPEAFHIDDAPPASEGDEFDLTLFFTKSSNDLESSFPGLISSTVTNGSIWISWPKKSSGVGTDLTEDVVRNLGLSAGVVDVKVCAVDDVWSGLKFVRRLRDRSS